VSWRIIWRRRAAATVEDLARRDPSMARRIHERLEAYAASGQGDVRKLEGRSEQWRLRVGSWRVVFVFNPPGALTVLAVSNRRDAYR
jgi:mRNA interferase RelE/StbE